MERIRESGVIGWLHRPAEDPRYVLGLTHGAGSDCNAPLLIAIAEAFEASGVAVLRYDLPFRVSRPNGPPLGPPKRDQDGVLAAAEFLQGFDVPVVLGGHSYGGRQTTIVASEDSRLATALLLLSYPLHPPAKPDQLRTAHFPALRIPSLFVHGSKDGFGSVEEMQAALALIKGRTELEIVKGAGHGLAVKIAAGLPQKLDAFLAG